MSNDSSKLSLFIQELKQRKVFRVAAVYLGAAFVLLEASEMILPRLALPDWTITLVMVLLGLGFPVAIIFSWIFDRTPEGVVRTSDSKAPKQAESENLVPEIPADKIEINPKSIAVLPFSSINKSEDDEILCDGITENILTNLARIGSMKVVSRTSVMQYKNTTKTIGEIGKELGVATILEGSVQKSGSRIRITGQLIATQSDEHLWADSYDKDYEDIFEIQSDVAQKIASALHTTLSPDEKKLIEEEKPTRNMAAYDYYLKGLYHWHTSYTKDGNQESADNFEKATELDPNFAVAYARAAFVHIVLYAVPMWDHTPERLELAKIALERARELAPEHPETVRASAMYAQLTGEMEKATQEFEKAFELQPNDYDTPLLIAGIYHQMGNWAKAEEYYLKTYEMSPRDVDPALKLGRFYSFMGDFDKAEHYYKLAKSYHPEQVACYAFMALHYINAFGETKKAQSILDEVPAIGDNLLSEALLYPKYHIAMYERNFEQAIHVARQHKKHHPGSTFLALAYYCAQKSDFLKTELNTLNAYYKDLLARDSEDKQSEMGMALILAAQGKKKDALQHCQRVEALLQKNMDMTVMGLRLQLDLAHAYTMLKEFESAIDKLEFLVKNPGHTTVWDLRLDPNFDPLRDNPRFQQLIAE